MIGPSFEQLIDHIYEAPMLPDGWMSLAPALREHFRAPFGLFMLHQDKVVIASACGPVSDEMVDRYAGSLWRQDRAMQALKSAPLGSMVLDSSLIDDRERARSPLYSEFLAPQGLERGLYASVARGGDGLLIASAQRAARSGDYDSHEIGLMRRIVPHLNRSFRTWQRLREVEPDAGTALDLIDHATLGIALVGEGGTLHFANRVAEQRIGQGALTILDGCVTTRSPKAAQALRDAIRAAARQSRAIADRVTLPGEGGATFSVLVNPVREPAIADLYAGPLAMLMIGPRHSRPAGKDAIGQNYGLTPAEARLLGALVSGERLPDYAKRHGISVTTAKTHLNALFDKVGERRQADLIRRALSDPMLAACAHSTGSTAPARLNS